MNDHQAKASINYLNEQRSVEVELGETILQTSLRSAIAHSHACGGKARCSSCRVLVEAGIENCSPRNKDESEVAQKLGFQPDLRLACQTTLTGNVTITKPEMDQTDIEIASLTIAEVGENKIGEEMELAILFADIEDYTSFTESVQAYDLVSVLNRYYYVMGKILKRHQGEIIDYYGDGMLAVFGFKGQVSKEFDSVTAGIEMMKEIEPFNDYLCKFLNHRFSIRIGIHTGKVIVGNIGFKGMRKLSVMGDTVNFASRIDTVNKELKTNFLISEATFQQVQEAFLFTNKYQVEVKGKQGRHWVYEVEAG